MKNLYFKSMKKNLQYLVLLLAILVGTTLDALGQVNVGFTQRTSQYSPTKKIYTVKGDFTMLGNTCLSPQNYAVDQNNNGQFMTYVDTDNDPNTWNSSSSTLTLSTENGAVPSCSNIVYAGLYWTGKSSPDQTFSVSRQVQSGTRAINENRTVAHNENISDTNYALNISRNDPSNNNRNPIYTFSGSGNTYVFNFFNSGATNRVTVSVNGGSATNIPVTVNAANTEATLTTPYVIVDGTVSIRIRRLVRSAATNLSSGDTRSTSTAQITVVGTVPAFSTVTKQFDKRVISLKGPASSTYTQFTAAAGDIYYPSGTEDDIYSAYREITDYVKLNGIGEYFAADMALLEGDSGGTGYSGGWGIIVVYENFKMKYRDITIFDGYAYVRSSNTSGYTLPVSGFNTVQTGTVGVKMGMMASEGDVDFTGDYFQIQRNSDGNFINLNHSGNSSTNFFNSSINSGGARNPNLQNNTGIDICMFNVPNAGNAVIGNNQTSTTFKYGTNGDTYSIFAIALAVDAYIPVSEAMLTATTINNANATRPFTSLPGQEIGCLVNVKNLGTEAINNYKLIIPIPYNASYVPGSAAGSILFTPNPTPNNIFFDANLGSNGSIVWDFGTLPLPAVSTTTLARLTFKLKATDDCSILKNTSCGNKIVVNGYTSGVGAITGITFDNSNMIEGYEENGPCVGQPMPQTLTVNINGSSFVGANCATTATVKNLTFCNINSVPVSEIASNFPAGSLFYNSFPVNSSSIQFTNSNPIPVNNGTSPTYYAIPPSNEVGCNFAFTVSKCKVIVANDDAGANIIGAIGGTSFTNVLTNDTMNGAAFQPSEVNLTFVSATNPGITLVGNNLVVAAGTPAGNYTLTYQICEIASPSNCDTAIVTVRVLASDIDANSDLGLPISGFTGGVGFANVLINDTLNDVLVNPSQVITTFVSSNSPGVTLSGTDVMVAPGTPAGVYVLNYQICEVLNPTNCDETTVKIIVTAPAIDAVNDIGTPINGANGGTAFTNVLINDTLNGAPVNASQVLTSFVSATNPGITLSGTNVLVAAGTPAGTYSLTYQICEVLNTTNCDTAIVSVSVNAPAIIANDDAGSSVNGLTGGTAFTNVLVNDTLNGVPVTPAQINLTFVSSTNSGITLSGSDVIVAPGTPAGSYTLTYQICEVLNTSNCDTAVVTVPVGVAPIVANDDAGSSVNGLTGGTAFTNVLVNDTLNGVPVTPTQINLTFVSSTNSGITLSGSDVIVAPGTPAGSYTLTYQICEVLNTSNCDTAVVTVPVGVAPIVANDDIGVCIDTILGGTTFTNVVSNDTLNGSPVNASEITVSFVSSTNPGITLSGTDVIVAPGTPAGSHNLIYKICEILNSSNCDEAMITISISVAPTVACYETATFNPTTCGYDVTGTQPVAPTVACYETATFNPTTCGYDITGTQPVAPTVACYETATFNPTTCGYDVTGTQPVAPTVACYETATFNPTTCGYDVTGTQPAAPTVACYETATFNPTTCGYDVTGTQPAAPTVACYETATFNPTTCGYDITGTEPQPISIRSSDADCNDDIKVTFDLNSYLSSEIPQTGVWTTDNSNANQGLTGSTFSPYQVPVGDYIFRYRAESSACPVEVELTMTVGENCAVLDACSPVVVYNAFSPNGDGVNEVFVIEQLDQFTCYPTNRVEIYNRWGVLVYETRQYDNETRVFRGISEGRVTVDKSAQLPTGTYFYILNYTTSTGENKHKEGYLYLTQ